jgi:hypothetical protein
LTVGNLKTDILTVGNLEVGHATKHLSNMNFDVHENFDQGVLVACFTELGGNSASDDS